MELYSRSCLGVEAVNVRGICLDALNPYGRPNPQRVLFGTGHRLVAVDHVDFYYYVWRLRHYNYQLAVVLTKDSYSPKLDYFGESHRWARVLGPDVLYILGNEWNIQSAASWPTANYTDFYAHAHQGIKSLYPEAQVYIGGTYSDPLLIDRLTNMLRIVNADGVDLHLYEENLQQTEGILDAVTNGLKLPVCMGEWNWQGGSKQDFNEYQQLLNTYTKHSFYFCWSDGMVENMGLTRVVNTLRKPEYRYYKEALSVRTQ